MSERNPYDPDVQLENAALLFLTQGSLIVAIALFGYLGERRPHHSPLWYGLGNGLARLARDTRSRSLLEQAIATLRRSLQEDPANPLTPQLLDLLRERAGLSLASFEAIPAFAGSPLGLLATVGFSPDMLVEATLNLPAWSDRMRVVVYLRQQDIEDLVPVLVAVVERDPHVDVRLAALKYLGRWGARADVRRCLERLVSSGEWRHLQPYVSMALHPIPLDWAQVLMRQVAADTQSG